MIELDYATPGRRARLTPAQWVAWPASVVGILFCVLFTLSAIALADRAANEPTTRDRTNFRNGAIRVAGCAALSGVPAIAFFVWGRRPSQRPSPHASDQAKRNLVALAALELAVVAWFGISAADDHWRYVTLDELLWTACVAAAGTIGLAGRLLLRRSPRVGMAIALGSRLFSIGASLWLLVPMVQLLFEQPRYAMVAGPFTLLACVVACAALVGSLLTAFQLVIARKRIVSSD